MKHLNPNPSPRSNAACRVLSVIICAAAAYGAPASQVAVIPSELRAALQESRYSFQTRTSGEVRADNDANGFTVCFSGNTTSISVNKGHADMALTLSLANYGWGSGVEASAPVDRMMPTGNRLVRHYGSSLTEWFQNTPQGLEQGFVVQRRQEHTSDPLLIRLAVGGGWSATKTAQSVSLTRRHEKIEYGQVRAWDARGATLPAHLTTDGANIEIRVDDSAAIYPVTIDPLLSRLSQLQELTVSGAAGNGDQFGRSVALSSDGNTALIGANTANNNLGAAYVYTRTNAGWTQQQELTELDPGGFDYFGWAVAISADGNTALIGAVAKNNGKGAGYIFTRSGTTWTQQQELNAVAGLSGDQLGASVALSGDGNTAILGAPTKTIAQGAAYVFARSGDAWSQQQELTAPDPRNGDKFGFSVALTSDGNTTILGAPVKNGAQGVAYAFSRSGTVWSQQQEFSALDGQANDQFGSSVALSADGSTALFASLNKAYVFTYSTAWSQQQEVTPSDGAAVYFGSAMALSSDGNIALLGAYGTNNSQGSAYVLTRENSVWAEQHTLIASDAVDGDQFGWSVSLSGDGQTALMAADLKNSEGAAYIFASDSIPPTAAPAQSPLPNSAGWNTTDVLVTWNWTDNVGGSGIDPANCTTTSASTGEGTLQINATCNDLAGNTGNASYTAKVDKTGPTVTATGKNADGTAYMAGTWTNQNVTVNFACSDSVSGVANCPSFQPFSPSTTSVAGTAVDVAGNTTPASFGPIQIERIPPTITAAATSAPNLNGWYNSNVIVHFTCQDADSGIPAGTCPADQSLTAEGATVSSTAMTVHDAAGNVSAPSNVVTVAIDKTSPNVIYSGNLGTYGVDQLVAITCSATDALSGISTATCSNINGAAYVLGVGSHNYSATATDLAGNTGSGSTTFSIVVTFNGVINLVYQWGTKANVAANLVTTLQSAQANFAGGNVGPADNQLNSFIKQVSAQSGKSLTASQATLLTQYAQALTQNPQAPIKK